MQSILFIKGYAMPKYKPLPEFINGFKVIQDLGTFENGRRRYLIAECKLCKKHFKAQRDSIARIGRKGCGCKMHYPHKEKLTRTNIPNRLRSIYSGMIQRCYNKNHKNFKNYGGKSIIVCEEWKSNNNIFFDWALKNGYQEGLTLDRINPLGNYTPQNCRFVTMAVNIQSRRSITKLNPDLIKKIRKDCLSMTTRSVALKYKISHRHLIDIKLKRSWINIQD